MKTHALDYVYIYMFVSIYIYNGCEEFLEMTNLKNFSRSPSCFYSGRGSSLRSGGSG